MDFLKSLGITDFKYKSQPSVKIPCYAEDSTERVVHFKLALTVAEGARGGGFREKVWGIRPRIRRVQ